MKVGPTPGLEGREPMDGKAAALAPAIIRYCEEPVV
jgi:hypothetical protein